MKYVAGAGEMNEKVVRARARVCVCEFCVCLGGKPTTHTNEPQHTCQHLQTQPSTHDTKKRNPRLLTPQHNTALLVHRAPQLITDPAPNPLLGHRITQSHVQ